MQKFVYLDGFLLEATIEAISIKFDIDVERSLRKTQMLLNNCF